MITFTLAGHTIGIPEEKAEELKNELLKLWLELDDYEKRPSPFRKAIAAVKKGNTQIGALEAEILNAHRIEATNSWRAGYVNGLKVALRLAVKHGDQ
ncbi:MAG: hypothetical protein C5B60_05550 [Chloroflexi bacterium]|nr:MAG: hypothetical protein C5B60_05550 [Chloroflexota bacterium]